MHMALQGKAGWLQVRGPCAGCELDSWLSKLLGCIETCRKLDEAKRLIQLNLRSSQALPVGSAHLAKLGGGTNPPTRPTDGGGMQTLLNLKSLRVSHSSRRPSNPARQRQHEPQRYGQLGAGDGEANGGMQLQRTSHGVRGNMSLLDSLPRRPHLELTQRQAGWLIMRRRQSTTMTTARDGMAGVAWIHTYCRLIVEGNAPPTLECFTRAGAGDGDGSGDGVCSDAVNHERAAEAAWEVQPSIQVHRARERREPDTSSSSLLSLLACCAPLASLLGSSRGMSTCLEVTGADGRAVVFDASDEQTLRLWLQALRHLQGPSDSGSAAGYQVQGPSAPLLTTESTVAPGARGSTKHGSVTA